MRAPKASGFVAAFCLGLFVLLALGVQDFWPLDAVDRAMTDQVPPVRSPWLNELMLVITALGDSRFLILVSLVTIGALLLARAWKEAGIFAAAFALTPLIVKLIKSTIARPRPTVDLYGGVESFSFPSGHATNSALIYGALALLSLAVFRRLPGRFLAVTFALLAAMIALSRIYLGAHWPSDTLAGLALAGLVLSAIAALTAQDRLPNAARYVPLALFVLTAAFPLYLFLALPDARELYTALNTQ